MWKVSNNDVTMHEQNLGFYGAYEYVVKKCENEKWEPCQFIRKIQDLIWLMPFMAEEQQKIRTPAKIQDLHLSDSYVCKIFDSSTSSNAYHVLQGPQMNFL